MTGEDAAPPHRVASLAWVLASFAAAALLAWATHVIGDAYQPEAGGPLALGAAEVLLRPADAPALTPAQAMEQAGWQAAALPFAAGWKRDTVWLRAAVKNTSALPQPAWLEVAPSWLTAVRLHSRGHDGAWQTQASGNAVRAADRPLDMAELVFPLELAAGEQRTVLVETTNRGPALTLGLAVHPAAAYPGRAERSNTLDLVFIGALAMLGLLCLVGGLALRHLGLTLLAGRAFVGVLLLLQQFGAGALFLSASALAALHAQVWLLFCAAQALLVAFIWSFMAQAGLARWAHGAFGALLAASLLLVPASSYQLHALLLIPFLGLTLVLSIQLVFKGYGPAVALLVGSLTAVMVNAPGLLGQSAGWVPRYVISPLPLLVTLPLLCLAAGLALRRERQLALALLHEAQATAVRGLEDEVARRTRELQAARDEASQANEAKSVFLAKVSHELRSPLHLLLGYVELAFREALPAVAARQLNEARRAGHDLVSQVNDLLEHARSERALLKLEPAALALPELARRLRDRMGLLAQARGNRFELALDPRLPTWVWADGHRLDQVLMALLDNAMRYTRAGRVTLRITALEPPAQTPDQAAAPPPAEAPLALRFEVEDSGRGISPAAMQRLFHSFDRGESVDAEGLGLGLSICRQLLALMDSALEATSQPGAGSCFAFTLHLRRAEGPELPLAGPEPVSYTTCTCRDGRPPRVLVLDDEPANRRYLQQLLGGLGFEVRAFGDVAGALAEVHAAMRAGQPGPDLCIVDQQLGPGGHEAEAGARARPPGRPQNGWEFIRGLRGLGARPGTQLAACRVLVLSATDAHAPDDGALAQGIDRHLLKPAGPQELLDTISAMLDLVWVESLPSSAPGPVSTEDSGPPAVGGKEPGEGGALSVHHAWQALVEVADSGSLTGLDEWLEAHPGLHVADARLQALVQALDFAGLARHLRETGVASPPATG